MFTKFIKFFRVIFSFNFFWVYNLLFFRLAPSIEHQKEISKLNFKTVIDVGANNGQFATLILKTHPNSKIICFEPQIGPFKNLKKIFKKNKIKLFRLACGSRNKTIMMNISNQDDSSSILDIGKNQIHFFPDTYLKKKEIIEVAKLKEVINLKKQIKPILLKIDTQGYELEVLKGSELKYVKYILIECSFIKFYKNQPLFKEIDKFLKKKNFYIYKCYNQTMDNKDKVIQADYIYSNSLI
jgi:FkbM family methyltransferase